MTDEPRNDESAANQATADADITYSLDVDERPSEAVVRAVSLLTNTPVLDLDPLYEVIDPDHLNGLFDNTPESGVQKDSEVSFRFAGCSVTVTKGAVYVNKYADDTPT